MNKRNTLTIIICALLLTTCSSNKPRPNITLESEQPDAIDHTPAPLQHIKLPIGSQWNTWHCQQGSFDTRYADSSKRHLQLRYQGGEHSLEQRPGDNPATYENGQIAFYSDGQTAVLARPASATVLLTGCRP